MRNMAVLHGRWSALALCLSFCGCTALSDCKYECGQKIRTSQAWHEFDGCNEERFTSDYRKGWKAGYYDVITGGSGAAPVIAPKEYWKPPVFFEHDPRRRNDWYCGFQDGAACGKCQPDHHYLQTWLPSCSPAGCQTHPVSHPSIPSDVPVGAPFEQPLADPMFEAGIAEPAADDSMPTVPMPGTPEPSSQDAGAVQPESVPGDSAYEADPEPSTTQTQFSDDWMTGSQVAETHSASPADPQPPAISLLQQLVQNSAVN